MPLFVRGKNKIELNETGAEAAACAKRMLALAEHTLQQVRAYHARLHTIAVESCAPAPLWAFLPLLSAGFPGQTVSSCLADEKIILEDVKAGACDIGILPAMVKDKGLECIPIQREKLSVCVPPDHELAGRKSVVFADLDGYNCLLRSQIGFWTEMCRRKMLASRFLIQTDDFALRELIRTSTLLCFTTNLAGDMADILTKRVIIPVADAEADVTYYMVCQKQKKEYEKAARELEKRFVKKKGNGEAQ